MTDDSNSPLTGFSSELDQLPDELNYRPVCGAAVAGMLLGAASIAAFFGPVLWAVGGLAFVVCCFALYRISTTTPPLLGKKLALIGLGLSVLLTTGAIAKDYAAQWLVREESRRVAELWLNALESGNMALVHQLTKEPLERDPRLESLKEVYDNNSVLADELKQFSAADRLQGLILAAGNGNVALSDAIEVVLDDGFDQVVWRLVAQEDGREQAYLLSTRRAIKFRGDPGGWRIVGINPESPQP